MSAAAKNLTSDIQITRVNKDKLLRKGLFLEYITLGWNVIECILVLYAGVVAGSVAMVGFGIDSVIEILASVIVVWQLKSINKNEEKFAEKLIGIAFFILALYIFSESLYTFIFHAHPKTSPLGMASLALTVVAMLSLAYAKGKVGKELGNPVLTRESKVTLIDGVLAASVLAGISLNALFGFWWADPLAGMVIVYYGIKEGIHALRSS